MKSRRLLGLLTAGLFSAWSAFAQTTNYPPRQDYENSYWTGQGSYVGDDLTRHHAPQLDYIGDPNGSSNGWVAMPDGTYRPIGEIVPHTDDDSVITKLQMHSRDRDLHSMRDYYNTESQRMAADTGAMGQAAAMANNSSVTKSQYKNSTDGRAALSSIAAQATPTMQQAGNNALVAQTFSGCSQQVVSNPGQTSGNQTQEKSCAKVQLKYTQGFAAHVYRTVTATFPSVWDIQDITLNPAPDWGLSTTMNGTLDGYFHGSTFPATTKVLTDFTVEFLTISGGPPASQFSYTVTTMPEDANNWTYSIVINRSAAPPDPVPTYTTQSIWVRLHWDYQGDPVYTFSAPICDQGDCSLTGDEFCKAKWTCNSQAPVMSTNGYLVPTSAFTDTTPGPLYQLIQQLDPNYTTDLATDKVCMDATLNIDCSGIYSGTACDANGCVTVPDTGLPNDCPEIEADPTCGVMDTECADWGFSTYSQYCYVLVERFYCYVPTTVPDGNVTTQTTCPGNQPCLDGSCETWNRKNERGYSRTQALGQQVIAQHFLNDWETVDEQTYDNSQIPPDPGATPGGSTTAAALAEYRDMLKAQERKLRDHPELLEKLKSATKPEGQP